ncbi:MAG: ABC transporter substrate-binding protein [Alphaproteobacteria bacterium]|nr:ABC transporter substrate-binding protein [Alphaproteobacteria bacterium]
MRKILVSYIAKTLYVSFISWMGFMSIALATFEKPYPSHGIDLYNQLKYAEDFKNFDYVNPNAPKGGELILAAIGGFDSLNPFVIKGVPAAGMTYIYASYFYATLLAHSSDEPLAAYGYIAEKIELAPDRSWIIFTLRKNATFHDGTSITPEDVIFTFNTLKEKGNPFFKAYYREIINVEQVGKNQVKFSLLSGKNLELPVIVGDMPILSKNYYTKHNFEDAGLVLPLGSGPYKIEAIDAGKSITYKRIENWWGENLPVNKGHYNFNKIKYLYFRDGTVAFEAFKSGAYDFRIENESKNWAKGYDLPAVKQGKLIKKTIPHHMIQGMQALIFNTRRDLFKNSEVRQALSLLFDFEWMNKNLFYGFYKRTNSYFENSELAGHGLPEQDELKILEAYRSQLPNEVFTTAFQMPILDGTSNIRPQIRKAQDLLKQAGWVMQSQKLIHTKTNQPFTFEILTDQPVYIRILQGFVNNLKRVGIEANIRLVDAAQYESRTANFDFDMIVQKIGQSPSPGNEQVEFWSSKTANIKGSFNYAGIKNPVIDRLIEQVVKASSRKLLIAATRALDRVLLWNYYVIPMWHNNTYWVAYWNKFGQPKVIPAYNFPLDTWWVDSKLEEKLIGYKIHEK